MKLLRCDVVQVIAVNRRLALHFIATRNSIRHIVADLAMRRRHGCAMLTMKTKPTKFPREPDAVVHVVGVPWANSSIETRYRFVNRNDHDFHIKNVIHNVQRHFATHTLLICYRNLHNCKIYKRDFKSR